jgi:flagellar hook-basal body complex protein FliE
MGIMDPLTSASGDLQRLIGRSNSIKPSNSDHPDVEGVENTSFADVLSNAMGDVQSKQDLADEAIRKLATGEVQDVHQVMVAFEQARLSMQMLTEVRNKLVEAYQEVSRMPL